MKKSAAFKKLTLVEREELNRLREKQIRDYNPLLRELVTLQSEMSQALNAKDQSVFDRVNLINLLNTRFRTVYKTLKYEGGSNISQGPTQLQLGGPTPTPGGPAQAPIGPALVALPPALAAGDGAAHPPLLPFAAIPMPDVGSMPVAERVETGTQPEDRLVLPSYDALGLAPNMKKKYNQLAEKLRNYPHYISKAPTGELKLFGQIIPDSNFHHLLSSLFRSTGNFNLTGQDQFLNALHLIQVTPSHISTKDAQAKLEALGPTHEPAFFDATTGEGKKSKKRRNKSASTKLIPLHSEKLAPPPGKRPKLLRLYR